ncbi:PQQ-binding-like beta-propeller repeat protein [Candidatus Uabimicrobium sp. HlEnr_7]|uniref:serine/threonine-protein kinase n=1 Tax=Candidatus Uabimicrobium helgolandensis TaxID=3095367 RepID=UPI003555EAEA
MLISKIAPATNLQNGNQNEDKKFGRYEILSVLGQGGMGKVYSAFDPKLNRSIALKILLPTQNKNISERFVIEAQAMARLTHPNIVSIYDIGSENGRDFFTMEHIKGVSLKEFSYTGNTVVCQIILKLAKAISYAHKQGVIHRDLKPSNIMMSEQEPKVMDFGLAKLQEYQKNLTTTGMMLGTLQYMSPEQANGQTDQIDARSDIYSVGVIFYEMLMGRPLVSGETNFHLLYQALNSKPEFSDQIPNTLVQICKRALHKNLKMRYQKMDDFIVDLENYKDKKPRIIVKNKTSSKINKRRKASVKKSNNNILLYLIVGFIIVASFIFAVSRSNPTVPEERIAEEKTKKKDNNKKIIQIKNTKSNDTLSLAKTTTTTLPVFQGDTAHTGIYDSAALKDLKNIKWRTQIQKYATASIIHRGLIFFAAQKKCYALDLKTGKKKWVFDKVWSDVYATPVASEETVYFASRDAHIYALDIKTGHLKGKYNSKGGIDSSPVIVGNMIYFGSTDKNVHALNKDTLKPVWKFATKGSIHAAPAIYKDCIYVSSRPKEGGTFGRAVCYALDQNGKERWRFTTQDQIIFSAPTIAHDTVYVADYSYTMFAVGTKTGKTKWRIKLSGNVDASIAVDTTAIYIPERNGLLLKIDAKTGNILWKFRIKGQITASPIIAEDILYIGSHDMSMYAINCGAGKTISKFTTSGKINSSANIHNQILYFASDDGYFYALAK